jgi:outer membrane protein OmpA-like peptidoglycan-associated protein
MKDSLFGFKDNIEREEFIIAIPVLLFFAWLGYYLLGDSAPNPLPGNRDTVIAKGADIDGDGVIDAKDRCTLTAGTVANWGCPEKVSFASQDADGDGILNRDDNCLHTAGSKSNRGCAATSANLTQNQAGQTAVTGNINSAVTDSTGTDLTAFDTDNDGVNDLTDQCPTLSGSVDNGGCPLDTDGDTIADAEDRCPTLGGVAANLGCPADQDKDGIYDTADNCPEVVGISANNGCPPAADADADADGVIDAEDQCPQLPGTGTPGSAGYGCPADADGDQVADAADLCPDVAGTIAFNGCPETAESDSDADGVGDSTDQCPDQPGTADNNGCPALSGSPAADADGDGIADADDQCPAIAGQSPNGCPVDSDGDGVADQDDLCNGVIGLIELRGCPADTGVATTLSDADQQILDTAVAQVAFNSSSATLTPRSKEILSEIAALMKKYPDAYLEISGHTDSSGSARRNMDLSMQRARACAAYIASEGITLDRLFAYGYGESQPVTDNATPAGRRQNRRVEFNLKFP